MRRDGAEQPVVELVRIARRRLRENDRELVPAHAAGDIGRADDILDPLGGLGEDGVAGEMADPVVDRLEVVEVEHDQREATAVAVRARDLAGERLVEVAAGVWAPRGGGVWHGPSLPGGAGGLV